MKMRLRHILILLVVVMALFPSCRRGADKVIPRGKLAKIYAEMLVTDQWVQNTLSLRRMADTSLVYDPILEKYGYTQADYQHTVETYMDDPERFSRILRTTAGILDGQIKELRKKQHQIHLATIRKKKLESTELPEFKYFINAIDSYRSLDWADTVKIELDSVYFVHKISRIPYTDTVYEGVRVIVAADTLAVKDTVAVTDTVAKSRSVSLLDSLKRNNIPVSPQAMRMLRQKMKENK